MESKTLTINVKARYDHIEMCQKSGEVRQVVARSPHFKWSLVALTVNQAMSEKQKEQDRGF